MNNGLQIVSETITEHLIRMEMKIPMMGEIAMDAMINSTEEKTYPYVPYLSGYLEGGFSFEQEQYIPLMVVRVEYNAYSNRGFNYAERQHDEHFDHPVRKGGKKPQMRYLSTGLVEASQLFDEQVAVAARGVI